MPSKTNDPESLSYLRAQLQKHKDIDIARHFTSSPTKGLLEKFNDALGIVIDLEWHMHLPADKIAEVGFVVFRMGILGECNSPADFLPLLKKSAVYHMRIIETCHMRNTGKDSFGIHFGDAERNSLFAPTRFVYQAEAMRVLKTFLDDQRCDDGSKRPVVLIGHGFRNDEEHFKAEWDWDIRKLESVVNTIYSLTGLGIRANIFPKPPPTEDGERSNGLRFHDLLTGFQIDTENLWLHNGASDKGHCLIHG